MRLRGETRGSLFLEGSKKKGLGRKFGRGITRDTHPQKKRRVIVLFRPTTPAQTKHQRHVYPTAGYGPAFAAWWVKKSSGEESRSDQLRRLVERTSQFASSPHTAASRPPSKPAAPKPPSTKLAPVVITENATIPKWASLVSRRRVWQARVHLVDLAQRLVAERGARRRVSRRVKELPQLLP